MENENLIILSGNLAKDPQTGVSQSGKRWANFTVAVGEGRDDNKRTNYFDCTSWEQIAEIISRATKGQHIKIVGRLRQEVYERDGKKNYSVKVIANMALVYPRRDQAHPPVNNPPAYEPIGEDDPF